MPQLLCRVRLPWCEEDVTVTLPEYPASAAIPLTVYCAQNQNLGYYLSGTTENAGNSIFTNTASASPAQGVGVQLTRNGSVVPANSTVSLGNVGTSAVSLGLTANYARTSGQVTVRLGKPHAEQDLIGKG